MVLCAWNRGHAILEKITEAYDDLLKLIKNFLLNLKGGAWGTKKTTVIPQP